MAVSPCSVDMHARGVPLSTRRKVPRLRWSLLLAFAGLGGTGIAAFRAEASPFSASANELRAGFEESLAWPSSDTSTRYGVGSLEQLEAIYWHRRPQRGGAASSHVPRDLDAQVSQIRAVTRSRLGFARALAFACAGCDSRQTTSLPPPTSA
jgi:hypothetical protein